MIEATASSSAALLVRNGVANLVRAGSASAVVVVLPIVMLAILESSWYPAWALIFSVSSYMMYFDVGIPATIQTLVAREHALGHEASMRRAALSGLAVTAIVVLGFLGVTAVMTFSMAAISPDMPAAVRTVAAPALMIMAVGQGASLLSNTAAAYFSGLQRSAIPAMVIAPMRILCLVGSIVVAYVFGDLRLMAVAFSIPSIIAFAILAWMMLRDTHTASEETVGSDLSIRGVLRSAGPLVVWGWTGLAATGIGIAVVSHFAYKDLIPYTLAQVVGTGIYGLITAISTPLLSEFARVNIHNPALLPGKVILSTRVHCALLYSISGAAICAVAMIDLITGDQANRRIWVMTVALVWAASVHMATYPLTLAFVAAGQHHRLIAAPVLQAVSTLVLAFALAPLLGGIGVAIGTTIGAFVGFGVACYWSVRRSRFRGFKGRTLAFWALDVPGIGLLLGTAIAALAQFVLRGNLPVSVIMLLIAIAAVITWEVRAVLPILERKALLKLLQRPVVISNR